MVIIHGQHSPITSSLATLLLSLLIAYCTSLSSIASQPLHCGIAVYWGQNALEGTLKSACDSGHYKYINIGFLRVLGGTPSATSLFLADHCTPDSGDCTTLSAHIRHCQNKGIKLLLSLAGGVPNSETQPPSLLADYIWNTYLSGNTSSFRPLGDAPLDGVDLAVTRGPQEYYADFVRALKQNGIEKNVHVSASPHNCVYPSRFLDSAIRGGMVDYVWVNFFNSPGCDYTVGVDGVVSAWKTWTANTTALWSKFFLGLPASPEARSSGYIPADVLEEEILPRIMKEGGKYSGVMIWNRYYDSIANYSAIIQGAVCDHIHGGGLNCATPSKDVLIS